MTFARAHDSCRLGDALLCLQPPGSALTSAPPPASSLHRATPTRAWALWRAACWAHGAEKGPPTPLVSSPPSDARHVPHPLTPLLSLCCDPALVCELNALTARRSAGLRVASDPFSCGGGEEVHHLFGPQRRCVIWPRIKQSAARMHAPCISLPQCAAPAGRWPSVCQCRRRSVVVAPSLFCRCN